MHVIKLQDQEKDESVSLTESMTSMFIRVHHVYNVIVLWSDLYRFCLQETNAVLANTWNGTTFFFSNFADGILRYVFAALFEETVTLQLSRSLFLAAREGLLYIPMGRIWSHIVPKYLELFFS